MTGFKTNFFKTLMGFLAGTLLLEMVAGMSSVVVSLIQCVFFAVFYTLIDKTIERVKKYFL